MRNSLLVGCRLLDAEGCKIGRRHVKTLAGLAPVPGDFTLYCAPGRTEIRVTLPK
jgi:hypothetical protein